LPPCKNPAAANVHTALEILTGLLIYSVFTKDKQIEKQGKQ